MSCELMPALMVCHTRSRRTKRRPAIYTLPLTLMTGAAAARIHNDTPQAVLTHLSADDADGSLCDAWQYTLDYLCRGLDAVPGLESGIRGLLALKDDILARFRPIRDAGLNARRIRTHGELNNRPDWVKIPLEGIREIM